MLQHNTATLSTHQCPNTQVEQQQCESWEIPTIQDAALPLPIPGKFPPLHSQVTGGPEENKAEAD